LDAIEKAKAETPKAANTLDEGEARRLIEEVNKVDSRNSHIHAGWLDHLVIVENDGDHLVVVEKARVDAVDEEGTTRIMADSEKAVLKRLRANKI
jgi:hypothetical protein